MVYYNQWCLQAEVPPPKFGGSEWCVVSVVIRVRQVLWDLDIVWLHVKMTCDMLKKGAQTIWIVNKHTD